MYDEAFDDAVGSRRWGFMYTKVIGDGDNVYMRRLNILTTPWFSIKLHRIYRPDQQRDLHDHPWNFLSIVLLGSYVEDVPESMGWKFTDRGDDFWCKTTPRWIRWFNWKWAESRHSISWTSRTPIWTLVFCGPVRRKWGFWTSHGFVPYDQYEKLDQP